jgi:hypothetical protein
MDAPRHPIVFAMRARRVLVVAGLLCPLLGCADQLGCDLDGVSRGLGGAGLIDCGIASKDTSDTSTVDRCAVTSFQTRATFRAIYEQKDKSLEGIVHAAGDKYYALRASPSGDAVERAQCKSASITTDGSRTFVACEKPGAYAKACN